MAKSPEPARESPYSKDVQELKLKLSWIGASPEVMKRCPYTEKELEEVMRDPMREELYTYASPLGRDDSKRRSGISIPDLPPMEECKHESTGWDGRSG